MSRSEAIESDVDLAYQAKLNGLEWPPFETRPAHDRVIRVALAASGKNKALTVSIRVKGPVGISDARAVADGEAARVVNKLAVVLNEPIGDPVRISEGWTIRGADGPQHHHVTSGSRVGVRAGGEAWVIRGPRAVEDLVIELEQVDLPDCDAELFRTLLSVDEVVAKFLALYVVIAGRLGDNRQRDVAISSGRNTNGRGNPSLSRRRFAAMGDPASPRLCTRACATRSLTTGACRLRARAPKCRRICAA